MAAIFRDKHSDYEYQEHFVHLVSEARRAGEVILKSMTQKDKIEFDKARNAELEQWLGRSVYSVARRAGVPRGRIMSMRWVLT